MKRFQVTLLVIFFIGLAVTSAIAANKNLMSIQIKEGHLRSTPSFIGKIIASLDYGDRVKLVGRKDLWVKVQASEQDKIGWIHESAITTKKIILNPGKENVEQLATSDELALAGKGFNKQVEEEFNSKNPQLDYTWVNKMEQMVVSQPQIMRFLKEGELTKQGVTP